MGGEKYAKNGCGKNDRTHFSLIFLTLRTPRLWGVAAFAGNNTFTTETAEITEQEIE
jgi:hypothetical protein